MSDMSRKQICIRTLNIWRLR